MEITEIQTLFLVCLYCVHIVSSSGPYMYSFRNNRYFGTKTQQPFHAQLESITHLLRNTPLQTIDEDHSHCNGIDIRELSILEIQKLFATGQLNSVALTNCYLQRIHHMNHILKIVIEVNPDAIIEAHRADTEISLENGPRGPMHGIPVLVKDNIATLDKTETTAGSPALLGIRPRGDADVIKELRKAGAVIIGKSNLSEFAMFRGTNIPNGWSGRGGQTLNVYNLKEDPEGSSSGSAMAVAANLATVALGTETDGSLIAPGSVGGLCTIKPTIGLGSTKGVIPISHTQDNVGPMARTMMDLAILFDAMITEKDKDILACEGSYMQCLLQKDSKKTFRIGILRFPFWDSSVINSTLLKAEIPQLNSILESLQKSPTFEVVDPIISPPGLLESISGSNELVVLLHDFKHDINEYLRNEIISPYATQPYHRMSNLPMPPVKRIASLKDIIQFNIEHPSPQGYNQDLLIMAEATDGLRNRTYVEARESNRGSARKLLDALLKNYELDAIVFPSEPRINHFPDILDDVPIFGDSVAAIAGYPSIIVPAGIGMDGVPFGLVFVGKPYSEANLFQLAHEVEQLTRKRKAPQFLV